MSGAAALVWLLAAEAADLSLPYGESSRPSLCELGGVQRAEAASGGAGPWERVRSEPHEALCLALARAQIRLDHEPGAVLEQARQLARRWPERPEPKLLEARALLRSGDAAASWAAWQGARELSAGAELGPGLVSAHALRDFALSAVWTRRPEVAVSTYRRLVSLLDAWPDPRHVQRLYLEAAAASLRAGAPHLDEALGYVSSALARARSTGLAAYASGLEAWIAERRGAGATPPRQLTEAEIRHFVELTRGTRQPSFWPALPRHEAYAVASLLVESLSRAEAAELWEMYLRGLEASGGDPAALGHARERRARLADA
ncbi:MAG TPA: hypothetical protein VNN80_14025, partial [Polyangiaceae bacterium]|nr:hypothetical protein [Polyangiaceae bacterium]